MQKFLNYAHYFPYDIKLQLLAHSRSFLANQKARNAIIGAENLLNGGINFILLFQKSNHFVKIGQSVLGGQSDKIVRH